MTSKLELIDPRINEQFEKLSVLHNDKKITTGNSATYLIKTLESCEPILKELSLGNLKKEIFEFNTDAIVRLFSLNANGGIKEVVQSGKKDILLVKIQGMHYGDSIIAEYKYLFEKLNALKKNSETEQWFKTQYDFFNDAYEKLGANKSSQGACYIATMAYGDYDHPQVQKLRKFRDTVLSKSKIGIWFILAYYNHSPKLVKFLKKKKITNKLIKNILNQLIKLLGL